MNHFLTVSRTEFLFDEKAFLHFREKIFDIVRPVDKRLRMIWEEQNRIVERVVNPFSKIAETGGTLERTEQRLRQLVGHDFVEKEWLSGNLRCSYLIDESGE